MSKKLTFSLASLVLIIGLVFATAPAMAQKPVEIPIDAADNSSLPTGGYLIVGNAASFTAANLPNPLPNGSIYVQASNLPDLEQLFNGVGGTILLSASRSAKNNDDPPVIDSVDFRFNSDGDNDIDADDRDLTVNDLTITEIMWGINKAEAGTSNAEDHQWIEIYNRTGQSIREKALDGLILDFHYDRPASEDADENADPTHAGDNVAAAAGKVVLDRVSNVVGNGWVNDLGQSGYLPPSSNTTDTRREPFINRTHNCQFSDF